MASSIHIEKVSSGSFLHNDRTMKVSYLIDDSSLNECTKSATDSFIIFNELKQTATENYTNRTKQKIQKNTIFIKEAIVNLEAHHTLKDLQQIKEKLESYGFKVIQMSIHRDEGFVNKDNEKEKNYHAHITMFNLDIETGKTVKFGKNYKSELSKLQTFTAETLQMQRGKISVEDEAHRLGKKLEKATKRLGTHEYKQAMKIKEKELEKVNYNFKQMQKEITALKNISVLDKREMHKMNSQIRKLKDSDKLKSEKIKELQSELDNKDLTIAELDSELILKPKEVIKVETKEVIKVKIKEVVNPLNDALSIENNKLKKQVLELDSELNENDLTIAELDTEIKNKDLTIEENSVLVKNKDKQIAELESELDNKDLTIDKLYTKLILKPKEVIKVKIKEVVNPLNDALSDTIEELQKTIKKNEFINNQKEAAAKQTLKTLSEAQETIKELKEEIDTQKERKELRSTLKSDLELKNTDYKELKTKFIKIEKYNKKFISAFRTILPRAKDADEVIAYVKKVKTELSQKDSTIEKLEKKISYLSSMHSKNSSLTKQQSEATELQSTIATLHKTEEASVNIKSLKETQQQTKILLQKEESESINSNTKASLTKLQEMKNKELSLSDIMKATQKDNSRGYER